LEDPVVHPEHDDILDAIDAVVEGLTANTARNLAALARMEQIREQRRSGWTYTEIVETAKRPLVVELLTTNISVLNRLGHRLRRAEAQVLRREGMTVTHVARLFGVSRQRITALVSSPLGTTSLTSHDEGSSSSSH
jgi:hypothetical protein